MTYLIYDLVLAVLLLVGVYRGYKKGFILTLCGFLAVFVAFIGATVVSNALAEPVSQLIRPAIEQNIQHVLSDQMEDLDFSSSPDGSSSQEEEVKPGPSLEDILTALKDSKLYKGFAEAFQKAVNSGVATATANAARAVASYIAVQFARMFLFLVSFVLIVIVWFFISHALDLAFKLPVLSTLNHWGGGALGLLQSGLLLYVACLLLKDSFLPQEAVEQARLLHWFCTVDPLALLT